MKSLRDVPNFGGTDADADNLLDLAFQDHEAYTEAVNHRRPLVIGRKGSGKTAVYKKIVGLRNFNIFTNGLTFTDYPWAHHRLQEQSGVPTEQRYSHSWQYLILMTLSKILLNEDQTQPWDQDLAEDLKQLRKFVKDSYGTTNPQAAELFSPNKQLRIKPYLKGAGDLVGGGVEIDSIAMNQLPIYIQDVNRQILKTITECLNPLMSYFVCFDELDKGFDPSRPDNAAMITGLLLASSEVNRAFRQRSRNASIIVFLRDDIYHSLHFEDKNKITESQASLIEWDRGGSQWTLKALLERRFRVAMEADKPLTWEDVFDGKKLSRHQTQYDNMLERTFRRPRDMIKFCNEVLAAHKRSGNDAMQFTNDDVIAAREDYSNYLYRELVDELHKHIPHHEDYFDILKTLEALEFSLKEFEDACTRRSDLVGAKDQPLLILRRLFDFSVVGYERIGGAKGGSGYVWRYLDSSIRFDGSATRFKVHPGLKEAFGLKLYVRGDGHSQVADDDVFPIPNNEPSL